MSDEIDELLAGSEGEVDEAEEAEVQDNRPSKAIKQLRDHAKKLERDANRFRKEAEELRAFKEGVEQERKASALAGAGLNEKQAKAFLRMYEDVKPEYISEFRTEVLGIKSEGEDDTPAPGFTPTVGDLEPSSKTITKQEFEAIMRENPAKGWGLLNSGKVQF